MPTVLITGANRGLGFELATQYAALGWRVLAGQAAGNHGFPKWLSWLSCKHEPDAQRRRKPCSTSLQD